MQKAGKYAKIFEPGKIGSMECKNRIVMSSMGIRLASETCGVTDRMIDFYAERAKGGVGLILSEAAHMIYSGESATIPRLSVASMGYTPGLNRLAEAVQLHGAKFAVQLHHPDNSVAGVHIGPSDVSVSRPAGNLPIVIPKPMAIEEIAEMIRAYVNAVRVCRMASVDAVQIHAAHGHLLNQFLSPFCNKRTDRYGGNTKKRAQILVEIVESIKREVGQDFPVMIKINGYDGVAGGIEIEEAKVIAQLAEGAGVDAIEMSAGTTGFGMHKIIQPMLYERCYNVHLAEEIKKVVKIPVMAVGSITEPEMAEDVLRKGKADFVSLGRALLADPYFVHKAAAGKSGDICHCIRCNVGCVGRVYNLLPVSCTVNAAVGKEKEFVITPTAQPKRILIVGGGPAGMEAARIAVLRGHQVTLYEKDRELGGQLLLAALPPHKEEIEIFRQYLLNQLRKLGVDIKLGEEVTYETVKKKSPDVVIVAAGAVPCIPDIPGAGSEKVAALSDVLLDKVEVGKKVAVVGGGLAGCETAHKLSEDGKDVTIVEMLDEIMPDVTLINKIPLASVLKENGVDIREGTCVASIETGGVCVMNKRGEKGLVEADNVIFAAGSEPQDSLPKKLEEEFRVFRIGDCAEPRDIFHAVREGSFIARQI